MKIYNQKTKKIQNVVFKGKLESLLKMININPETVVVTKNNEIITPDELVEDSDEIRILSVVSGG